MIDLVKAAKDAQGRLDGAVKEAITWGPIALPVDPFDGADELTPRQLLQMSKDPRIGPDVTALFLRRLMERQGKL